MLVLDVNANRLQEVLFFTCFYKLLETKTNMLREEAFRIFRDYENA